MTSKRFDELSLGDETQLLIISLLIPALLSFWTSPMTQVVATQTTLLISLTLLLCNSIVCAQDGVLTVVEKQSVPVNESKPTVPSTDVIAVEKNVEKPTSAKKGSSAEIPQARPGERVLNPAHEILNLDTALGGVEIKGEKVTDFGYLGPGDMRTHLWNAHANELIENGITEHKLMAMTVPEVQKWHNYFHGVEGSPEHEHEHDEGEQSLPSKTAQQHAVPQSPTFINDPVHGTIVYENFGYDDFGYPQSFYGQPGIIYEQGGIIQESSQYDFQTPMQPTVIDQGVIQSGAITSGRLHQGRLHQGRLHQGRLHPA